MLLQIMFKNDSLLFILIYEISKTSFFKIHQCIEPPLEQYKKNRNASFTF